MDENILSMLPEGRRIAVRVSSFIVIIEEGNLPGNVALNIISTGKVTSKTLFETGNSWKYDLKQFNVVQVAKKLVFEPSSVASPIATSYRKCVLLFIPDYGVASKGIYLLKVLEAANLAALFTIYSVTH